MEWNISALLLLPLLLQYLRWLVNVNAIKPWIIIVFDHKRLARQNIYGTTAASWPEWCRAASRGVRAPPRAAAAPPPAMTPASAPAPAGSQWKPDSRSAQSGSKQKNWSSYTELTFYSGTWVIHPSVPPFQSQCMSHKTQVSSVPSVFKPIILF